MRPDGLYLQRKALRALVWFVRKSDASDRVGRGVQRMRTCVGRWVWRTWLICMCGTLMQAGCLGSVQRELDLLWAPEANLGYVYNSSLVKWFGPQILQFW